MEQIPQFYFLLHRRLHNAVRILNKRDSGSSKIFLCKSHDLQSLMRISKSKNFCVISLQSAIKFDVSLVFMNSENIRSYPCSRLEKTHFNGQSIGVKKEIGREKLALNNFKAYGWQR